MTRDADMAGEAATRALTTDRKSARKDLGRRRWSAEQKQAIVAESMQTGATIANIAGKHAISPSQLYAWRQQLLLASRMATSNTPPSLPRDSARQPPSA